jgi:hypothetical protein
LEGTWLKNEIGAPAFDLPAQAVNIRENVINSKTNSFAVNPLLNTFLP